MEVKLFLVFLALLSIGNLNAQTPAPSPPPNTGVPVWKCKLPGGTYEVAVNAILAVSSHEYLVDGVARVTEVNVDTTGSLLARFYYIEPITPNSPIGLGQSALDKAGELANELAERTGQDQPWKKVVKSYPTTTHARTVEYRVESAEQLTHIFHSAETAFRQRRQTDLTINQDKP
jgi:hypothetical protein